MASDAGLRKTSFICKLHMNSYVNLDLVSLMGRNKGQFCDFCRGLKVKSSRRRRKFCELGVPLLGFVRQNVVIGREHFVT